MSILKACSRTATQYPNATTRVGAVKTQIVENFRAKLAKFA